MKATTTYRGMLAAFLLAMAAHGAWAGSGGSTYSMFGLGDLRYTPGVRSEGMGYAGLGLLSPFYINGMSPATWARIDRTLLEGSAFYEGFNSTDGTSSRYLARMDFHGALLAIPLSKTNGIVVVGGFTPYSEVNYDTYSTTAAPGPPDPITGVPDTLKYAMHYSGSGGLTRAQLGVSWRPLQDLSIGASFNYLFGTLNNQVAQSPVNTALNGATLTHSQIASGITVTTGIVFSGFGSLSEALRPFSMGLVLSTRANLRTDTKTTYAFLSEHDTSSDTYGRIAVPFTFGAGLAYQPEGRWSFAADYSAQPWGEADFNGSSPAGIRNSHRFGIGAERAALREQSAAWLEKITYRLGFMYTATYFDLNGEPINEWGITAGLALPLSGESRLNLSGEYGERGTTASGLVKDRIFRMTVSLNISDIWFVPFVEE